MNTSQWMTKKMIIIIGSRSNLYYQLSRFVVHPKQELYKIGTISSLGSMNTSSRLLSITSNINTTSMITKNPFMQLTSNRNNDYNALSTPSSTDMSKLQLSIRWFSSTTGNTEPGNPTNTTADNNQSTTQETSTNSTTTEPPPVSDNDPTTTATSEDGLHNEDVVDAEPIIDEEEDAASIAAKKQSKQIREMKDALLRSLAEQENTRTIAKRDVDQARQYAIKSFAKSLLDVADNLQRALDAVPQEYRPNNNSASNETAITPTEPLVINPDIFKTLYEGIEMTEKGLKRALENHGVVQFGKLGDIFDPNMHEALMEYQDNTKPNNTVGIVMKCGYTLNTRVLRPAEVGVIKSTITTATTTESNTTETTTQ
jgi:molecular chaperone GrpE